MAHLALQYPENKIAETFLLGKKFVYRLEVDNGPFKESEVIYEYARLDSLVPGYAYVTLEFNLPETQLFLPTTVYPNQLLLTGNLFKAVVLLSLTIPLWYLYTQKGY